MEWNTALLISKWTVVQGKRWFLSHSHILLLFRVQDPVVFRACFCSLWRILGCISAELTETWAGLWWESELVRRAALCFGTEPGLLGLSLVFAQDTYSFPLHPLLRCGPRCPRIEMSRTSVQSSSVSLPWHREWDATMVISESRGQFFQE